MDSKAIFKTLGRCAILLALVTALCGVAYPLLVTGFSAVACPWQANGSIIEVDGVKYGSALVGQPFQDDDHLWGRPTVASAASFSDNNDQLLLWYEPENLSPASQQFADKVQERIAKIRAAHPDQNGLVPSDLVTVSGSGFDPHISPAAAEYQVGRLAKNTGKSPDEIRQIIASCTEEPLLGCIGQARVNVLEVNLKLDGLL